MNKVLVFDIWAEYAHFKKYYTTTSPLTFAIPPKTTLYGLIGAILGLDKEEYLESFQEGKCQIGIEIKKPIKKTRINLNLIDTKKAKLMSRIDTRTQIKTEYLKDVKYRIYFQHQVDEIYDKLKQHLIEHKAVYSISLGLSENLANFEFVGEYEADRVDNNEDWVDLKTVMRIDSGYLNKGDIDFSQSDREYYSDKVALEMKPDREVIDYAQIVFEGSGKTIKAKPKAYYRLESGEKCLLL
ncbi:MULTISPECIES: type I-B CRISPR-associated protein Cas5b [unclassified Candidatus Frackibacter]|uniref:type I-B CRISPR-associated protein Cas5b n=1 Tax=unclassified Candidatus Frackibacter TaxID=2648818 RepID=UPI000889E2CF|nr:MULTISPECIES: type I-B CRISPR-associated protein Cas5b [unclassified Candidatus Frackibacter]SDC86088.1 CRISPR-associated protein, Cas5h family [Candidatus Frackibacter sp. WG11]SEN00396.1 CRISPR-associated protein, Cas5h family [Candidatus Frackibacter sp. WG12]SFL55813.1 CRISPR-associated protein, Cas5h family [Candidatus Frackibacter sp. WG13]